MKLSEMFNSDAHQGRVNIKKIVEAKRMNTGATILAGTELLILESTEVKEVYDLYETSLEEGTHEEFVAGLGQLNENIETLEHILTRFPKEVKDFELGHDLDDDLYHALYDYYNLHGEMPYGVAKARTGDPFEWVTQQLDAHLGGGMQIGMDADRPAEAVATNPMASIFDSLTEGKNPWLDLSYSNTPKVGDKKRTSKGEVEYTSTGQIHRSTKRYGGDDPENVEDDDKTSSGEDAPKRGRGRPRTRPVPDANAPKRGRGRPRKNPLPDPKAPKRGRGRPKKVREWIDSLRSIAEGEITKTAAGVKHTATNKYGSGDTSREKYARDLEHLDKNTTSRLDKSMGIKHDHGNKKK